MNTVWRQAHGAPGANLSFPCPEIPLMDMPATLPLTVAA